MGKGMGKESTGPLFGDDYRLPSEQTAYLTPSGGGLCVKT